jgi:hypothetical protein
MDDKTKIFEKIQKCLRLSKSANANEAATALRQAQKLMEAHGITQADLDLLGYSDIAVDVPIQKGKKVPIVLSVLVGLITSAFGVDVVFEDRIGISDISWRVRYFGPSHRVQMAAYAHVVVYRAMEGAWREFLATHPRLRGQKQARTSFQVGWLDEVAEKVDAISFTEIEQASTDALVKAKYTGTGLKKTKTNTSGGVYESIHGKGKDAAKDFSLHRPMHEDRRQLT